ncbi:MAG: aminopeptidase [Promethearchaeota archaeon]
MTFRFLSKQAKLCVNYSVEVQKGESVLIQGSAETIPLMNEIYREVLRAGGHPMTNIMVPGQDFIFYKEAQDHQLDYSNPFELYYIKNFDIAVRIRGLTNTRELSNIDPKRIQRAQLAQAEFWKIFFGRQGTGELKWVVLPYPTIGMAQEASMSQEEFADLIEKTCLLHKDNPIDEWKKVSQDQQKYCNFLEKIDEIHIVGEGTDIKMSVKGRKWENCNGKKNLPDGEIFTGPVENSINGQISFSFPGIYQSREIEGIVLKFKNGKVIKGTAKKGQELLETILKIPGAERVGELAFATNYNMKKFVKNMLFDEKIGGTIHMALGNGWPETGSENRSAIHWDCLCDMREEGQIFADGNLIYEKGKFLV